MAILGGRRYGNPVLRRRAERVREVTPEIRATVRDMIDTMYHEVGIGLAAPQVGVALRLMVVDEEKGRGPLALINPEIVEEGGRVVAEEGCLSIPGIFATVARAEWVRVEAQGVEGQPLGLDARGLLARVLQHEMDHLDGVLFIDRLDPLERDRVKRQIRKGGLREDAPRRAFALYADLSTCTRTSRVLPIRQFGRRTGGNWSSPCRGTAYRRRPGRAGVAPNTAPC